MGDQSAGFTGNIPEDYDHCLGPVIFVDYAADMAARVAESGPVRVLEMAAGTGIVTRALLDRLPAETRLTATDLNAPMLEVARRKFRPDEAVDFQPADAQALPFEDGTFDAVVCQFGVMFFPDRDKAYREAYRVLVPGGRFHFSVWDSHGHNPYGRLAHETAQRFFPADPPSFYTIPFGYHDLDPIRDALAEAGFADIAIAVHGRHKPIGDLARFARGLVYGNPMIEQIRARGGVDPDAVVEAIRQALQAEFGPAGHMPMQAILIEAVKPD